MKEIKTRKEYLYRWNEIQDYFQLQCAKCGWEGMSSITTRLPNQDQCFMSGLACPNCGSETDYLD